MAGASDRAGRAYPSRASDATPVFCGVHIANVLVFCVMS